MVCQCDNASCVCVQTSTPARERRKRQADPEEADPGEALDLLSLLQDFGYDPGLGKTLVCTSDQVYEFVHFSNVSAVESTTYT